MLHLNDAFTDELYIAGQRAPSGRYREVGTGREVILDEQDILPASLDGRVAAYICVQYTWGQHQRQQPQDFPGTGTYPALWPSANRPHGRNQ
jgi:hypothetical protein